MKKIKIYPKQTGKNVSDYLLNFEVFFQTYIFTQRFIFLL